MWHNCKVLIPRQIQPQVSRLLEQFPAVAILGPRQVGKTTLATTLADALGEQALYLDLESPSDRAKLTEPEIDGLTQHENRLVILDEIHRLPRIFETLRSLIDRRRRKSKPSRHFLLPASASMDLLFFNEWPNPSLDGLHIRKLLPLWASEVAGAEGASMDRSFWSRGGFPDSFLAASDDLSFTGAQLLSRHTLNAMSPH